MDVETFRLLYRIALIAAGVLSVVVPITYWWVTDGYIRVWPPSEWDIHTGKWKDSVLGRHLMGSDLIIAVIFAFSIIATLIDYPKVELTIGILLFSLFGYLRFTRARLMLDAKKAREDARKYAITEEDLPNEPTV